MHMVTVMPLRPLAHLPLCSGPTPVSGMSAPAFRPGPSSGSAYVTVTGLQPGVGTIIDGYNRCCVDVPVG